MNPARSASSAFAFGFALLLGLACFTATPAEARAKDGNYRVNLWAGLGGSLDNDDAGLSNSSYQLGFSFLPEDQVLVGLRLGEVDLGNSLIGTSFNNAIDYATVGGEYRFTESFYESGLYIGLGAYRFEGTALGGGKSGEDSVGLVVGISGEFMITRSVGFLVEFSGHYTNLSAVDSLAMGHAGISIHF